MSVNVVLNGVTYSIPEPGDSAWGQELTDYFIAQSTGLLQKAGGTFTLTSEVDFGTTYGLKSAYFKSRATNPATAGVLRLGVTDTLAWRNNANSANLLMAVNGSNQLTFDGQVITGGNTGDVTLTAVGSSPNANAASLVGQALTIQPADGSFPGVLTAGTQTIGGAKTFSGAISASNLSGTNTGDVTLTAVGATPSANGASLSGQALTLQPASSTLPGVMTALDQTFAGNKAFLGVQSMGGDLTTIYAVINSDVINQTNYGLDSTVTATHGVSSWGNLFYYVVNSATQSSSSQLRGTLRCNLLIQPSALTVYNGIYTGMLFTGSNVLGDITGTFRGARITAGTGSNAFATNQFGLQVASTNTGTGIVRNSTAFSIEGAQAINTDATAHVAAAMRIVGPVTASGSSVSNTATGIEIANNITATGTSATAYAINSLSTAQSVFAGSLSATSLSTAGQVTSSVATGTAPLVISSTTQVANLNVATAGTATNIAGGSGGSIPYQSSASTTALLANGSAGQVLTSAGTTLAPVWASQLSAPTFSFEILNAGLAASVASSALTIALKQSDGSTDPSSGASAVKIGFRSSTLTSGLYNERSVTGALSIVVPSGATLGVASGSTFPIYVYAIDNAGTVELAVSSTLYDEGALVTTVAIGAGSTDDNVIYSTTLRSSVPVRLLFRLISTQTTAGTWAAVPTAIAPAPFQSPLIVRAANFATTRVTGAAPTKLGEYRSQLRNAGAFTLTDTNGAPTATPSSADGYKIYAGGGFSTADTNNQPTHYQVYVGKNKNVNYQFYASAGRTGAVDATLMITPSISFGYVKSYDPSTGIVEFGTFFLTGTETSHNAGVNQAGGNVADAWFDILITNNRVGS